MVPCVALSPQRPVLPFPRSKEPGPPASVEQRCGCAGLPCDTGRPCATLHGEGLRLPSRVKPALAVLCHHFCKRVPKFSRARAVPLAGRLAGTQHRRWVVLSFLIMTIDPCFPRLSCLSLKGLNVSAAFPDQSH